MPELRYYQKDCLEAIWGNLDRNVVACIPTGGGKSHVIAELCKRALVQFPGTKIIILAHVKELLEQNADKLRQHWPDAPIGIYCAGLGRKELNDITVASIQSIYRKTSETGTYELIIIDEAHRIPITSDTMYRKFIEDQRAIYEHVKIIGLTATPYRMKTGFLHLGADAMFDSLVYNASFKALVADGFLCKIISRRGAVEADTEGISIVAGEFKADDMEAAFSGGDLVSAAVSDVLKKAKDRKSILVFSSGVDHAGMIEKEFHRQGETNTAIVTGDTGNDARNFSIWAFKEGAIRVLINCNVLTTGFDAPNVDCLALLRATRSAGLYVQILGRGSRTFPGKKDCLILDYGRNILRHGPIDEVAENINISREVSEKIKRSKTCHGCGSEISLAATSCPQCGYSIPREEKKISHDTEASQADPMAKTDQAKTLPVCRVSCKKHTKDGKPPSLRITYSLENGSPFDVIRVDEFICPEHGGFAATKAAEWIMANVEREYWGTVSSVDDLKKYLEYATDNGKIKWPTSLKIAKEGKFWRIKKRIYA